MSEHGSSGVGIINQVRKSYGDTGTEVEGDRTGTVCGKVMVADDHAVFREGLRLLMEARAFCGVVLEAFDGDSARAAVLAHPDIDLAVLDLNMPGMESMALLKDLRSSHPALAIVVLTASERRNDMRAAMAAGATGYIPKSFPINKILAALEKILAGENFFPADALPDDGIPPELGNISLSPRQREVLSLIARGKSNKEIARLLDTALPTVKNHVANIFEKLGTRNRVAAVNLGRKVGLIPDE